MLSTLYYTIKDTFFSIHCKNCKFKSLFAIAIIWHLMKEHKVKLTKRDWKFLAKYNLLTRLIKSALVIVVFVPLFILKVICIPFVILDDIL